MILCGNPRLQYLSHEAEINEAILKVLHGDRYILGDEVRLFEEEFSSYIGVKYGVGVASGTDAIALALRSCGIGLGDEVITVSHTAVATVAAIELVGATPVLVDIDPKFYTIDHNLLEMARSERTRAIIPVHIYGQSCNLDEILSWSKKHNILVIEDCCQAHGATWKSKKVGSWGDLACFSFYPTKNLGAIGDGGIVITDNKSYAEKCRLLREYGWKERYISQMSGANSRLDEIQAAILRVKLKYLNEDNLKRNMIANFYDKQLPKNLIIPSRYNPNLESFHAFHLYVIRSKNRDKLLIKLKEKGIIGMIHYPVPIHKQPAYIDRIGTPGGMSVTELVSQEILSLPIYPELTQDIAIKIVEAIS